MPPSFPRRGEIYIAAFDPVVGSEQGGRRPALIIQNDNGNEYSSIVIVATITSAPAKRVYPIDVVISAESSGLRPNSRVLLNQIKSIDKQRLGRFVGRLSDADMARVEAAIKLSLALD
jgi:mRNA interferase MazF